MVFRILYQVLRSRLNEIPNGYHQFLHPSPYLTAISDCLCRILKNAVRETVNENQMETIDR